MYPKQAAELKTCMRKHIFKFKNSVIFISCNITH